MSLTRLREVKTDGGIAVNDKPRRRQCQVRSCTSRSRLTTPQPLPRGTGPLQYLHDRHGAGRSGRPLRPTPVIIGNANHREAAMPWNRAVAGMAAGGVAGLAVLAGRYAAGVKRADREWPGQVE